MFLSFINSLKIQEQEYISETGKQCIKKCQRRRTVLMLHVSSLELGAIRCEVKI